MAHEYDDYGRLRGFGQPGYYETRDPVLEPYPNEYHSSDSRDNNHRSSASRRRKADRQRTSTFDQHPAHKMSTTSLDSEGSEHVSPETIAAITERIKREGMSDFSRSRALSAC